MNFQSAVYSGILHHRRLAPKFHDFKYRVTFYYLDLAEIDRIFKVPFLFSTRPPFIFGFNRQNYLAGADSLTEAVQELIFNKTGKKHVGSIRMLSQITYFGFCFNPVTFYYCMDENNTDVNFIVAEITNTPWNERKSYVFECAPGKTQFEFQFEKDFHVSPFFPMNLHYVWKFKKPNPVDPKSILSVFMEDWNETQTECVFFAHLNLKPKSLTLLNVSLNLISFPFMTLKTVAAIYFQSFLLLIKRVPFFTHPAKKALKPGD